MRSITYNDSEDAKRAILKIAGKSVDKYGYIIDEKGQRVVAPNGEEVKLENFAGIRPGSEVFITNDLPSLLEQADYIKD
jgi:hypothetical protein